MNQIQLAQGLIAYIVNCIHGAQPEINFIGNYVVVEQDPSSNYWTPDIYSLQTIEEHFGLVFVSCLHDSFVFRPKLNT